MNQDGLLIEDVICLIKKRYNTLNDWIRSKEAYDRKVNKLHNTSDYPFCTGHGELCVMKSSHGGKYPGRAFYRCAMNDGCDYFQWTDSDHAKVGKKDKK